MNRYGKALFDALGVQPNQKFKITNEESLPGVYYIDDFFTIWEDDKSPRYAPFYIDALLMQNWNIVPVFNKDSFSEDEKTIIKFLWLYKYKCLARDKNGRLYAYLEIPNKVSSEWVSEDFIEDNPLQIPEDIAKVSFDWIKWEDTEPFDISMIEEEALR